MVLEFRTVFDFYIYDGKYDFSAAITAMILQKSS